MTDAYPSTRTLILPGVGGRAPSRVERHRAATMLRALEKTGLDRMRLASYRHPSTLALRSVPEDAGLTILVVSTLAREIEIREDTAAVVLEAAIASLRAFGAPARGRAELDRRLDALLDDAVQEHAFEDGFHASSAKIATATPWSPLATSVEGFLANEWRRVPGAPAHAGPDHLPMAWVATMKEPFLVALSAREAKRDLVTNDAPHRQDVMERLRSMAAVAKAPPFPATGRAPRKVMSLMADCS
jgi:hypothetical protein